jgi:hypothetical protein
LGWSAGVDIFSLGKKNSLRSDTFFLAGKNIDPTLIGSPVIAV